MSTLVEQQKQEILTEEKIRRMMLRHRVTFQEAKMLVEKGQRGLFEF